MSTITAENIYEERVPVNSFLRRAVVVFFIFSICFTTIDATTQTAIEKGSASESKIKLRLPRADPHSPAHMPIKGPTGPTGEKGETGDAGPPGTPFVPVYASAWIPGGQEVDAVHREDIPFSHSKTFGGAIFYENAGKGYFELPSGMYSVDITFCHNHTITPERPDRDFDLYNITLYVQGMVPAYQFLPYTMTRDTEDSKAWRFYHAHDIVQIGTESGALNVVRPGLRIFPEDIDVSYYVDHYPNANATPPASITIVKIADIP